MLTILHLNAQCEDVVLSSQNDVDNLTCLEIFGDLIIRDNNDNINDIRSLEPLRNSGLMRIKGDLVIENSASLISLDGIDQIQTISGSLIVRANESLMEVNQQFDHPFILDSVGGSLIFENNENLAVISGFVNTVISDAIILNNLDTLRLVNNFDRIDTLKKLIILDNELYDQQINFRSLKVLSDSLIVQNNSNLQECCWVTKLADLTNENRFIIQDNGLGCESIDSIESPPPTLSQCPTNQTIFNVSGECYGQTDLTTPMLMDDCNLEFFLLQMLDPANEVVKELDVDNTLNTRLDSLPIGVSQFRYLAKDRTDSIDMCTFSIKVEDVEFPVFMEELEDDTLPLIGIACLARYSIVFPDISDNCDIIDTEFYIINELFGDTVFRTDAVPGINYNIDLEKGVYRSVAFVSDANSLTDITSAEIVVRDDEDLTLLNCPEDITIDLDQSSACFATAVFNAPTIAQVNCSEIMLLKEILSPEGGLISGELVEPGQAITDTFFESASLVQFRLAGISGEQSSCRSSVNLEGNFEVDIALTGGEITCADIGVVLSADIDTTGFQIFWTGPNGFESTSLQTLAFIPGTYVFTVVNKEGCTFSEGIDIFQGGGDIEVVIKSGEVNCDRQTVVLFSNIEGTGCEYFWSGPQSFESDSTVVEINNRGWYFLRVEGEFGCIGEDSILINHDIEVNADLFVIEDSASIVIMSGTPPYTFEWNGILGDSVISDLENGMHNLVITDGLGCTEEYEFTTMVSSTDKIEDFQSIVYPNPFRNELWISNAVNQNFSIFDVNGKIKAQGKTSTSSSISLRNLTKGVYFLRLEDGKMFQILKI